MQSLLQSSWRKQDALLEIKENDEEVLPEGETIRNENKQIWKLKRKVLHFHAPFGMLPNATQKTFQTPHNSRRVLFCFH